MAFVEDVDRDGIACVKYRITGPALGDQEGLLWLHKEKGYIQDAEIPVRSEPGLARREDHPPERGEGLAKATGRSGARSRSAASPAK